MSSKNSKFGACKNLEFLEFLELNSKNSKFRAGKNDSQAAVFKAPPSSSAYVFAPMPSQAAQGPEAANDHQMPPPKPSKKTAPWQVAQAAQGSDATQKRQEPEAANDHQDAPWQLPQRSNATTEGTTEPDLETY